MNDGVAPQASRGCQHCVSCAAGCSRVLLSPTHDPTVAHLFLLLLPSTALALRLVRRRAVCCAELAILGVADGLHGRMTRWVSSVLMNVSTSPLLILLDARHMPPHAPQQVQSCVIHPPYRCVPPRNAKDILALTGCLRQNMAGIRGGSRETRMAWVKAAPIRSALRSGELAGSKEKTKAHHVAGFAIVIVVGRRARALHQDGVQAHQTLQQGLTRLHRTRQLRGVMKLCCRLSAFASLRNGRSLSVSRKVSCLAAQSCADTRICCVSNCFETF